MKKISMKLPDINKNMTMKLSITYHSSVGGKEFSAVSQFTYQGERYMRLNPYPRLSIEIKNDTERREVWNINRSMTLDQFSCYKLVNDGKRLLLDFRREKDLFYYEGGKLVVNKEIATRIQSVIRTEFKACSFIPNVVLDGEKQYEGVTFFINGYDNYCSLTYEEYAFMIDYLSKLDFNLLSTNLLIIAKLYGDINDDAVEIQSYHTNPIIEEKEENLITGRRNPTQENLLPDI